MTTNVKAVAVDYGGTIDDRSRPRDSAGNRPVDPSCIAPLRVLRQLGLILIVSTNTEGGQHRRAALETAGIGGLFRAVLASDCIGLAKPDPAFYALVAAAAGCAPAEVLHAGDKIEPDVLGPLRYGMQAALIRPGGLAEGEDAMLPPAARVVRHVRDLPSLITAGDPAL